VLEQRLTHGGSRSETEYFMNCNTTWGELIYQLKAAAMENRATRCSLPVSWGY